MGLDLCVRNIVLDGRRTSVRLEAAMWEGLLEIARRRGMTANHLVTEIDQRREHDQSRTSAIRVYIVEFYRLAMTHAERQNWDEPQTSRVRSRLNLE